MKITVHKLDHEGKHIFQYDGILLSRTETMIQLEAYFFKDITTSYHHFRKNDRMVEWFYSDRWYNIFQMHDVDDDRIKGWYCNITRPAKFENDQIYAEDLALDLMVYPDGRYVVLDEDEFEALNLDAVTRQNALDALASLQTMIEHATDVFAALK